MDEVRKLYELYPVPSKNHTAELIYDLALSVALFLREPTLAGQTVLDAGCGTGHRLIALAAQHPEAKFVGLDFSLPSLAVAEQLAKYHKVRNVEFVHGAVGQPILEREFDLVVSTGLLHILPDPVDGLRWLLDRLTPDGFLYTWLLHTFGHQQLMLERELVGLLSTEDDTTAERLRLLRRLGLRLPEDRYGSATTANAETSQSEQDAMDADAYLNPVLLTWRFGEAMELVERASAHAPLEWTAINGVNWEGGSKLVDIGESGPGAPLCLTGADLFSATGLRRRFTSLPAQDQLDVIELRLRPVGFGILMGRGESLSRCSDRVAGNVLHNHSRTIHT